MAVVGPVDQLAVRGAGTAFPARTLSNADVLQLLSRHGGPVYDDPRRLAFAASGLEQTQGFSARAWAHVPGEPFDHAREESTLSLAISAADRALGDARTAASDVALVLVSTSTPPRMTSTLSGALGAALGCQCACMDVRTGCAAGLFALASGALFLQADVGPVLLVGTETFSKVIPPSHKMSMVSLGDGAGAFVLERRAGASLRAISLMTDGTLGKLVSTDGALPPTDAEIARGGYLLTGEPDALAETLPGKYLEALGAAFAHAALEPGSASLYVPHQTSAPLIAGVAARFGFPADRVFTNLSRHANVGAAGWLVALCEARAEGRAKAGDTLAIAAVGGGMSWASAVWRW